MPHWPAMTGTSFLSVDYGDEFFDLGDIEQHTENTVATREGLETQFEEIRKEQVAVDFGEARVHIARIASPVFADGREFVGVIGIAGATERIRESHGSFTTYAKQAAMAATHELGGLWHE